jgi:RNA polymerase sigma-70 factor (ECF subfamily)
LASFQVRRWSEPRAQEHGRIERTPHSDEELMVAYVSGDQGAFSELFHRYAPMLLRMMQRHVRYHDAAEIVQQTFLQLHRARYDYDAGRPLRPWLITIACNLRREHFRRQKRRPEASLDVDPPASGRRPDAFVGDDIARLRRALDDLPEGQREVIALHWFEELGFAEVASLLGLTVSAVKVRAHRGYRALRRALEEPLPSSGNRSR